MPKILFIDADGSSVAPRRTSRTPLGDAAVDANVRGIDCGGFLN